MFCRVGSSTSKFWVYILGYAPHVQKFDFSESAYSVSHKHKENTSKTHMLHYTHNFAPNANMIGYPSLMKTTGSGASSLCKIQNQHLL